MTNQKEGNQMIEREVVGSKGNIYTIVVQEDPFAIGCTCRAGQMGQLCKHVKALIEEDDEIRQLFEQSDLKSLYDEYISSLLEVERAKKLSDAKKHQLAREMLLDIVEIDA